MSASGAAGDACAGSAGASRRTSQATLRADSSASAPASRSAAATGAALARPPRRRGCPACDVGFAVAASCQRAAARPASSASASRSTGGTPIGSRVSRQLKAFDGLKIRRRHHGERKHGKAGAAGKRMAHEIWVMGRFPVRISLAARAAFLRRLTDSRSLARRCDYSHRRRQAPRRRPPRARPRRGATRSASKASFSLSSSFIVIIRERFQLLLRHVHAPRHRAFRAAENLRRLGMREILAEDRGAPSRAGSARGFAAPRAASRTRLSVSALSASSSVAQRRVFLRPAPADDFRRRRKSRQQLITMLISQVEKRLRLRKRESFVASVMQTSCAMSSASAADPT